MGKKSEFCVCDLVFCFVLFLCCFIAIPSVVRAENLKPAGICAMNGCNCTVKAHHWIFVKCVFSDDQDVDLLEGTIPEDTMEVEVSHCRELRIQTGAFTGGTQLKRVHVSGIYTVVANRQAFQNLSAPNPLLEVSECNRVILESHAFKNTKGPLSVSISRCRHVTIKPSAFSWLLQITVREVPNLELSSNAFKFETPQHGRHGPATKIMFHSVKIPELPTAVFPSTAAEVRMDDIWTKVIRKDAFCSMNILSVIISNASIFEIETGAFNERTLIHSLEFVDVRLKTIRSGALRAGANNLTIQYSRLTEVEKGAIDISVATVTFNNNEFQNLRQGAITFHQWNRLSIDYNMFDYLETDAISARTDATSVSNYEFSFFENRLSTVKPGALAFTKISQKLNSARVSNNYFKETCNCNMETWVQKLITSNSSIAWMMDTSYCLVDKVLRNCFNLPEGNLGMLNYTKTICSKGFRINCTNPLTKPEPSPSPPSVGPHIYPRQRGYFDVEMSDPDQLEREKRIIVIACVVAVFSVLVVILTSGILYMRRRGVCPKLTSNSLTNFASSWFSPTSGMTAATSARSISRLSVHEYAGLQPETRILEIDTQPEEIVPEDEGTYAYMENKATQTLPEELTAEYLQNLKDRLNDPDNYGQARDMIEHLYDLVKVEESCNNNNNEGRLSPNFDEDNAYDIIIPKSRKIRIVPKSTATIGTKIPSLEKLLPITIRTRPQIVEYAEPRDLRINNDQNHLYAELPGDETMPSTSRLVPRAPQPLPPDVVNDHIISENYRFSNTKEDDDNAKDCRIDNSRIRSNFFKSLGESILGGSKISGKRPNSLLCEYAEPSDATAHLYSELSDNNQCSMSKMANRPLPTKPDQPLSAANQTRT
ncbi:uncharacterized protein LOC127288536 [Leptopilina boulardi]|uniref:uncharacterized protein LOC127288536 n=1 Tax=Leptopilina boulardi TaxID=63433 RepID=UPI0021F603C0|nr:uncharacterized protein LOC127288536 [Leptopilina boulardi]